MARRMGIMKKPAIFIPRDYHAEVFKLSKAALADIAWNLAAQCVDLADDPQPVIAKFRQERDITIGYRKGDLG